jgi:hypothetical protein
MTDGLSNTNSKAPRPPRAAALQLPGLGGLGVVALLSLGTWYLVRPGAGADGRPEEASRSATIEDVVEESRPQIRECWDRALSTRARGARSEVRVDATIVIATSGAIERITTTGDPEGYPKLAACVESKIQKWRFPKPLQSTTVDVPFVFGGP